MLDRMKPLMLLAACHLTAASVHRCGERWDGRVQTDETTNWGYKNPMVNPPFRSKKLDVAPLKWPQN